MYQYKISTQFGHGDRHGNGNNETDNDIVSLFKPEYININTRGFADLLSCCLDTTNHIRCAKDKIEHIKEPVWEEIKKSTNPYELIYAAPSISVASFKPLSRSFFKMIEMINEFASKLFNSDILISLHIAEGPGGFIEATRYIRNSKGFMNDSAFGITLINKTDNGEIVKNIPAWKQSNYFLRNHPEVIISYGVDGTGNIYNPDNINHLYAEIQYHCSTKYINPPTYVDFNNSMKSEIINKTANKSEYRNNMFAKLETDLEPVINAHSDVKTSILPTANVLVKEEVFKEPRFPNQSAKEEVFKEPRFPNPSAKEEVFKEPRFPNVLVKEEVFKGPRFPNSLVNKISIKEEVFKEPRFLKAFITADGGFDYSIDYNYQEQASSKLIFSQIITALKCQAMGGIFICKIFDMNLLITIEMIYLLNLLYKEVIIYKPFTSRVANSEKYLVCSGFKGVEHVLIDKLLVILAEWNKANLNGKTFNRLFTEIPAGFIDELKKINKIIVSKQINVINGIMHIYHNKLNLDTEWKKENFNKQHLNAVEWCKKYNIHLS